MFNISRKIYRWFQSSGFFFRVRQREKAGSASGSCKRYEANHISSSLGRQGELQAKYYLQSIGYKIIEQGHRQSLGEIDLIALDGSTIVFVEVKTWTSDVDADPSLAVDRSKQEKITRTALMYLKRHRLLTQAARFDVVSIVWSGQPDQAPRIRHFQNAFEAVGRGQLYC